MTFSSCLQVAKIIKLLAALNVVNGTQRTWWSYDNKALEHSLDL